MIHPFAKGQGAFIKITSLAVGLTVGLVLLAKVQLERNYDRCIVDKEHVYELQETMQRAGEEPEQHGSTSGGIAPALVREIPEVVTATRYTAQFGEEKLTLEDGSRHYFEQAVFADSCFFDIFVTRTLVGDAKQILLQASPFDISPRVKERMRVKLWHRNGNIVTE
jgi:putative ABC transport system permease protein